MSHSLSSLRTIARAAADNAALCLDTPTWERNAIADAVAAAVGQEWARYRPQHDEGCGDDCAVCGQEHDIEIHHSDAWPSFHQFERGPCNSKCGLSALIASLDKEPPSNVIQVPKVPGPKGICWQTGPMGTVELFHHCMLKKGHRGKHQWEK